MQDQPQGQGAIPELCLAVNAEVEAHRTREETVHQTGETGTSVSQGRARHAAATHPGCDGATNCNRRRPRAAKPSHTRQALPTSEAPSQRPWQSQTVVLLETGARSGGKRQGQTARMPSPILKPGSRCVDDTQTEGAQGRGLQGPCSEG